MKTLRIFRSPLVWVLMLGMIVAWMAVTPATLNGSSLFGGALVGDGCACYTVSSSNCLNAFCFGDTEECQNRTGPNDGVCHEDETDCWDLGALGCDDYPLSYSCTTT